MSGPTSSETTEREATLAARPPGWINQAAFVVFWLLFGGLLRLWFRLRVENPPRLRGAYVVAPNHTSLLDPLLVGAANRRRITFMMTALLYRSPRLHWFYRWNHVIPVEQRSGNRRALRAARDVLRSGRVLGVFPEGGISRDGRLMLGNPGTIALVLSERVPVVPVGVVGASRAMGFGRGFPRPSKIVVRFGDPILPEELEAKLPAERKKRLGVATALVMERIAALSGQRSREQELADAGRDPVGSGST